MARHTKEEALRTRERILDAAVEVFHERGVARPSLSDIAELIGVTRGAVYGHFANKADLFSALCDRVSLPLEALCRADPGGDPLGRLRETWVMFLRDAATHEQRRRILAIVFHRCELTEDNGAILQRLHQSRSKGMANMRHLLEAAVAQGQLPADLDLDLALTVFHGAVVGLLSDWLFDPGGYDLESKAGLAVDALITMLSAAPGLRR